MKTLTVLGGAGLVLLAGCAAGPDYQRPAALPAQSLPAAFGAGTNEWKVAEPAAHLPRGTWWSLFDDAELSRLETLATSENQTLVGAVARFDQARAEFDLAHADLFPNLAATGSATRQRTSVNAPQSGKAAGVAHTYNTFATALELGWEVDLWGRARRESESARAAFYAVADDLAAVKLALQTEVAADYFTLRALDTERALVADTIETYRRSLELTRNRRQGGIVSDLDVAQAETQLRTAEAQLPALELQRTQLLHALATLCGQPATSFNVAVAATTTTDRALPNLPVSLPSELLERRPDIAAAERRMAAANANVGVAQAAFYPRIRLNGLAGFESVDAGSAFNWPSRMWSVGPSLELPLFTGGRNRAQLAAARAGYDATVANYRQTVLSAFADVEDQLAAQRLLAAQLDSERAALAAAEHTLAIANNRYKAGLVTFLEVATAQSAALERQRTVAQLEGEQRVATVGLVKALGGGWDTSQSLANVKAESPVH
ncbi:MAG TPA: efflux transporter outer membrane subunit [Verrucomicrobiae bacterium]|nr:efflux transporter outer membrane subunit [Verrucomicrobiae bacterium]